MKTSGFALVAGLGLLALTLPASAASSVTGDAGLRFAPSAGIQLAQTNTTRQTNEERASDYRTTKKSKKAKRSKKMR